MATPPRTIHSAQEWCKKYRVGREGRGPLYITEIAVSTLYCKQVLVYINKQWKVTQCNGNNAFSFSCLLQSLSFIHSLVLPLYFELITGTGTILRSPKGHLWHLQKHPNKQASIICNPRQSSNNFAWSKSFVKLLFLFCSRWYLRRWRKVLLWAETIFLFIS